jgi:hypothetical protein
MLVATPAADGVGVSTVGVTAIGSGFGVAVEAFRGRPVRPADEDAAAMVDGCVARPRVPRFAVGQADLEGKEVVGFPLPREVGGGLSTGISGKSGSQTRDICVGGRENATWIPVGSFVKEEE